MSNAAWSRTRLARMHSVMAGHVERGYVPGLVALVSRRGATHVDVIGTKAFDDAAPMERNTIFRIASMTKPIMAAAAMILVEECRLRLDDPVDELLPELASRRVLNRLDGPLDDTVPAHRPITLRDLLTFRLGIGLLLAPGQHPIQDAMSEAGIAPGPNPSVSTPDEYMKRLGALPLMHQPGEVWMYHTGSDVLGVLVARAASEALEAFLRERLFAPLGMNDTGFHVPEGKLSRLPPSYLRDPATGSLVVHDDPERGRWSHPPPFPSGGGGLVSTADDCLAFFRMMLAGGRHGREHILSRPSVELMTLDHLTPEQRAGGRMVLGDNSGWGFGVAVINRRDDLAGVPGRFGWSGGIGTSAYADPREDLVGILMTQRCWESPSPSALFRDFWTTAYQAIDD